MGERLDRLLDRGQGDFVTTAMEDGAAKRAADLSHGLEGGRSHGGPPGTAGVDHLGINEGVRRASKDRLAELKDDYGWISEVLEPPVTNTMPLEKRRLEQQWAAAGRSVC